MSNIELMSMATERGNSDIWQAFRMGQVVTFIATSNMILCYIYRPTGYVDLSKLIFVFCKNLEGMRKGAFNCFKYKKAALF